MQDRAVGWRRWYTAANLITLSRIPLTLLILPTILMATELGTSLLPSWSPWIFGVSALGMFWQGGVAQTLALIADWLDGFVARHLSWIGPTAEGQFLDQFVDKLFVWAVWAFLSPVFYRDVFSLFYWYAPAFYLVWLDARSCRKHWRNYLLDRDKPEVEASHGAVWPGKLKFLTQNVVICLNMAALCPEPSFTVRLMDPATYWVSHALHVIGISVQPWSCVGWFVAIALARSSLRQRGVLPPRKEKA